ncbi:SDR family oxidoreductase [Streptomyces sp. NPDC045470]|uniref:SDR family oxidoreductase n=1 Tax=Streptomyces sp. NPDC045470 TaxID=3155469 RepID=UPI0033D9169A
MPVAVVTGASKSKGLGRAPGAALAGRGWDLVVDARSAGPLEEARGMRRAGARVMALPGDVADAAHRAELVAAARELGGPDLPVNSASVLGAEPLVRLEAHPLDGLRAALEVNAVAPLGLVQKALPLPRASQLFAASAPSPSIGDGAAPIRTETTKAPGSGGAVLNIGSDAAAVPDGDGSGRPLPETVVPAPGRLLDAGAASGRHAAPGLLGGAR